MLQIQKLLIKPNMENKINANESEFEIHSVNETRQYYDNVKIDNTNPETETSNE